MIPIEQGRNGTHAKTGRPASRLAGFLGAVAAVIISAFLPVAALAADNPPQVVPWQISLQPANSIVMRDIHSFTVLTFWIVGFIVLFVMALLLYVIFKFNAKANPVPSKVSHNTTIEIIWTVVPILILVIIAVPSLRLLYEELEIPAADLTVKATGSNWKWTYDYPDLLDAKKEPVSFASNTMTQPDDKPTAPDPQKPRLLAVDNNLVVPVGKVVHVLVTADAASNIHSFALPAFGIKVDAMPGRLNDTWFRADNVGMYYGECSELCGTNHAYMPIAIQVVSEDQYKVWSEAAKTNVDDAYKKLAAAIDADETKTKLAAR